MKRARVYKRTEGWCVTVTEDGPLWAAWGFAFHPTHAAALAHALAAVGLAPEEERCESAQVLCRYFVGAGSRLRAS